MTTFTESDLAFAESIARQAGQLLLRYQRAGFEVNRKGTIDLVTTADRESERLLVSAISGRYPAHAIISEEDSPRRADSDCVWYVDPLDGTTDFVHHHPNFAISLGLYTDGSPALGVVYNPDSDEMFSALRGGGARMNGAPVAVSSADSLIESLLASGFPYDVLESGRNIDEFLKLTLLTRGVRISGAAALDLVSVACGRLDGYWEPEIKPWDGAAGVLIVREAGGRVTDLSGKDWHPDSAEVLASNRHLHPRLMAALA